eukprot:TRINITY_DN2416_c0_g1_i3.p1 TRINITY_DN2416_c0_g1~~TRINITY_DN2416_c0_g1_i3.p1  ORF type:complete len:305 (+),score=49.06 TRINITY_DN2416_c0_g1_i3:52-966(+)
MTEVRVQIKHFKGSNLKAMDWSFSWKVVVKNTSSDPYLVLSCKGKEAKSEVKEKTLNPEWDNLPEVRFQLNPGDDPSKELFTITCMDRDEVKSDDFMGKREIPLHVLLFGPKKYNLQFIQDKQEREGSFTALIECEWIQEPHFYFDSVVIYHNSPSLNVPLSLNIKLDGGTSSSSIVSGECYKTNQPIWSSLGMLRTKSSTEGLKRIVFTVEIKNHESGKEITSTKLDFGTLEWPVEHAGLVPFDLKGKLVVGGVEVGELHALIRLENFIMQYQSENDVYSALPDNSCTFCLCSSVIWPISRPV